MYRTNTIRIPITMRSKEPIEELQNEKETPIADEARSAEEHFLAGEPSPGEEPCSDEKEMENLRQQAAEYRDKYLRAMAEMDNYKKRVERRYADETEAERKRLLRAFLAVADNLERALAHTEADGAFAEGVELTYQDLQRLLRQEGVEPLTAVGQPFDPELHEAVAVVPGDDAQAVVVDETQKGYLYRGELLRPAKVVVSQAQDNRR
ncbi:MAG: nucleotide exchange factor GrpE [Anaerolineae bacterium]|nr:nucleotide exchange factor GrpE [Anaerolineae bacterium]